MSVFVRVIAVGSKGLTGLDLPISTCSHGFTWSGDHYPYKLQFELKLSVTPLIPGALVFSR